MCIKSSKCPWALPVFLYQKCASTSVCQGLQALRLSNWLSPNLPRCQTVGWFWMHETVWGYCFEAQWARLFPVSTLPETINHISLFHFSPAVIKALWRRGCTGPGSLQKENTWINYCLVCAVCVLCVLLPEGKKRWKRSLGSISNFWPLWWFTPVMLSMLQFELETAAKVFKWPSMLHESDVYNFSKQHVQITASSSYWDASLSQALCPASLVNGC